MILTTLKEVNRKKLSLASSGMKQGKLGEETEDAGGYMFKPGLVLLCLPALVKTPEQWEREAAGGGCGWG